MVWSFLPVLVGQWMRKDEDMICDFAGKSNSKDLFGSSSYHKKSLVEELGLKPKSRMGNRAISALTPSVLYQGIEDGRPVMRYHSTLVEEMSEGFEVTARLTDDQAIMWIQHKSLPI